MGKFILWDIRHPLEVVMTTIAEVDGSETKEDSDRATEVTLVLKEVEAVLGTDLKPTIEVTLKSLTKFETEHDETGSM